MAVITVLVADEESARRAACLRLLAAEKGIRVIAEASSAAETFRAARLKPRILLLDSRLATGHDAVLLPMVRRTSPDTRVIVLTGQSSRAALLGALARGAHGYLNRRLLRPLLAKAVRKVDAGEIWVARKLMPSIVESVKRLSSGIAA